LLKNGANTVTIVDIAPLQLKNARFRKEEHSLESLECVRAGAENLPFKDDSFDLGYIYLALHHFPNHSRSICEVCRVSREVIFVDIMNPALTRILTRFGFWRQEGCGITPHRLNEKDVENTLINQKLKPKVTYFFVVPSSTHNRSFTRGLISFFKLANQIVSRSRTVGLLCGNVAIISGTSMNKAQSLDT
jgi:SAM-dependent methyltransferase